MLKYKKCEIIRIKTPIIWTSCELTFLFGIEIKKCPGIIKLVELKNSRF